MRTSFLLLPIALLAAGCPRALMKTSFTPKAADIASCTAAHPTGTEPATEPLPRCTSQLGDATECSSASWISAEAARCIGERAFAGPARPGLALEPVFLPHEARVVWDLKATWPDDPCEGTHLQLDATDGTVARRLAFQIPHCRP